MNFLSSLFGARKPVRNPDELARFIDENAAFVVQKGIYEYARARAGHYSKVLFGEAEFQRAVEVSRWRAYPLGLAMVAEVAATVLQQEADVPRQTAIGAAKELALAGFDRWPVPAALSETEWRDLRAALVGRLDQLSLHPPKRAMDIPELFAEPYFALMPIHESLRAPDFPTLKNYLKVTLCNVQDELARRIDAQAVADRLAGRS